MTRIVMESDIGMLWGAGRIADAINFLGGIIALWVLQDLPLSQLKKTQIFLPK